MRRLELEAPGVLEDSIVRDEWDAEAERGRGDPAISVLLALAERVTDPHAIGAQTRVGATSSSSEVDHLDHGNLGSSFLNSGDVCVVVGAHYRLTEGPHAILYVRRGQPAARSPSPSEPGDLHGDGDQRDVISGRSPLGTGALRHWMPSTIAAAGSGRRAKAAPRRSSPKNCAPWRASVTPSV